MAVRGTTLGGGGEDGSFQDDGPRGVGGPLGLSVPLTSPKPVWMAQAITCTFLTQLNPPDQCQARGEE